MDFKDLIFSLFASSVLFIRRSIFLVIAPYKTMRKVARDEDSIQPVLIMGLILVYFFFASSLRSHVYHPIILFEVTLINLALTILFFAILRLVFLSEKKVNLRPFLILFTYTLIPTLIWFLVNSFLFRLLPPPRTFSLLGRGFSLIYLSFSIAILFWKIIITYLAIRYSTTFTFFRIIYSSLLYLLIVIPYSVLLYSFGLFRIPFL
ncbi:hypothetical protein COY14_03295 [Candidatus Roizmanbacteria bacterium CG_4_10_14_0_2_um_filter_36_9]|uniref:Yip1 domain-containing protein n=1 Tax=Candidatus Roizmanbacteria bacterium CG_4_10_14_0_2_um_filter_36_9 TaxID=1974823 RepID=A0A2M7U3E0_9BACT|nr:MAG: hypothetical protein COY14_03295 [Candidatus Roizmanbacteria bacterium CG_4_10_14_0_2_um_filter_36_9]